MHDREPVTQTMTVSAAREQWSDVLEKVSRRQTRVIVEERGVPVAAIVSADDLERLERLAAQRAERFRVLDEMRAAFSGVPEEEIEREVAKAIAEVRAENRQREQDPGRL